MITSGCSPARCATRDTRHNALVAAVSNPQLLNSTAPEAIMVRCCSKCLLLSVRTSRAVANSCSDGTRFSGAACLERLGKASAGASHAAASCSAAELERRRRARVFIGRAVRLSAPACLERTINNDRDDTATSTCAASEPLTSLCHVAGPAQHKLARLPVCCITAPIWRSVAPAAEHARATELGACSAAPCAAAALLVGAHATMPRLQAAAVRPEPQRLAVLPGLPWTSFPRRCQHTGSSGHAVRLSSTRPTAHNTLHGSAVATVRSARK